MQKINWTQAMDENITALRDSGMSHDEIGFSMGISGDCVSGRIRRLKNKTSKAAMLAPSKDVAKTDVLEMEIARLRLELEKSKSPPTAPPKAAPQVPSESRVVVKAEWNEHSVPMQDIWEKAERESVEKIDKAKNQGRFSCEFPSDRVVAISFISDQHIAPGTPCDFKRMRSDAELVASTPDLYCVLNGDGVDNHVKHFAAVLHARSTPNDQWLLYEHYLQILSESILVVTAGNHDCLDTETEVLTQDGWKSVFELSNTDQTVGVNRETGCAEWQGINEIITKQYKGKMRSIYTNRMSLVCTPGHRILTKNTRGMKGDDVDLPYELINAEDFNKGTYVVPCSAKSGLPEYDICDDYIKLCGIILTDGHVTKNVGGDISSFSITQRESNVKYVTDLVEDLGLKHSVSTRDRNITHICGKELKSIQPTCTVRIMAGSCEKLRELIPTRDHLPQWLNKLSDRQFSVFMAAIVEGDGSWASHGGEKSGAVYKNERFIEELQVICATHGWSTSIVSPRPGQYKLNICNKREHCLHPKYHNNWIDYEGTVWCLRVPNENFLVRRDGKVHYTGNCWTNQYAGVDMVSKLARANKFCYAPFEARMNVKHGAVDYKIALRHQYRLNSSFNQNHAVKQWQRLGDEEFDIGCIGHHHEACIEMFMYRAKECWGCRPGAYQITSAYAAQYGYNDAVPTCPSFLLFPDTRKIIGLPNVHDVPAMLKTFNG